MLKLEKSSHLNDVTVRIRERDRFFDSLLLKALAIALFFHLSALILFQVTPFSLTSTYLFPPAKVQSKSPSRTLSAIATPTPDDLADFMPPSMSLIPSLEMADLPQDFSLAPLRALDPDAFQPMEEELWPIWEAPLKLHLEEARIRLAISGDLSQHPLIASDPLLNQKQPFNAASVPVYVTYSVQIDDETGEVFWFERLQSSGNRDIDQETEKIVLNLRFKPDPSFEHVKGILDFVVHRGG